MALVPLVTSIIGYILLAAAATLALLGLFGDRARGKRRCPSCWYDMAGSSGLLCPECGRTAPSQRHLFRTRRRWKRVALAALVALLAYLVGWTAVRIQRSGWIGVIPTSALVWRVGMFEPPDQYVNKAMTPPTRWAAELATRLGAEEMWNWQWAWLMREVGAVRAHDRWPRGKPYLVSTGVPIWTPNRNSYTYQSSLPDAGDAMDDHMFAWEAGTLETPGSSVPDCVITLSSGKYRMAWQLKPELVDTAENALTPVTGAQIDAAVRAGIRISLRSNVNPNTNTNGMLGMRLTRANGPVPDDMALGLVCEFIHNGTLAASYKLCPLDSPYGEPGDWIRINAPGPDWNAEAAEFEGWIVRIRGDAATSLRDLKRSKYWAGSYEVPLREFMR